MTGKTISRRDFVKKAATLAAVAPVAGLLPNIEQPTAEDALWGELRRQMDALPEDKRQDILELWQVMVDTMDRIVAKRQAGS